MNSLNNLNLDVKIFNMELKKFGLNGVDDKINISI